MNPEHIKQLTMCRLDFRSQKSTDHRTTLTCMSETEGLTINMQQILIEASQESRAQKRWEAFSVSKKEPCLQSVNKISNCLGMCNRWHLVCFMETSLISCSMFCRKHFGNYPDLRDISNSPGIIELKSRGSFFWQGISGVTKKFDHCRRIVPWYGITIEKPGGTSFVFGDI